MQIRHDWERKASELKGHTHHLFKELASITNEEPIDPDHPDDDLIAWLSELGLMSNVPFHYLIPSESILPNHSIRFFYVNPSWQQALIDGACSLGRNASLDLAHDQALIDAVFAQISKRMKAVRPMLQRKPLLTEQLQDGVQLIGGFVLRSPLVRGWRGLEFKALSKENTELRALRIELLSDDVLIGLFDGVPYTLQIAQPPEGFYFGFNQSNGRYYKRLRDFDTGALLAETDTVEVAILNKGLRTIDVCQTAKNMEAFYQKEGFTSAEFALQMIKTPYIGQVVRSDED